MQRQRRESVMFFWTLLCSLINWPTMPPVSKVDQRAFGKAQRRGIEWRPCYAYACGSYVTLRVPFAVTPGNPFGVSRGGNAAGRALHSKPWLLKFLSSMTTSNRSEEHTSELQSRRDL